jgi:electron transfer flavoprotein beta subunit
VERQTEAGFDEVTCPLPAVVSVTAGVVEPRYPSFKGIMAAKSKPIETLSLADLGLDHPTVEETVEEVRAAEARQSGAVFEDDGTGFEKVVAYLEQLKLV